ncbi:MAG: hypothetical protein Q9187_009510, partial [Circinaria calcarea]
MKRTHLSAQAIKLLVQIDLAPLAPDAQLLLPAQHAHLAVVLLVPQRRGGGQEKGAGDDGGEEGQAEEEEGVRAEVAA